MEQLNEVSDAKSTLLRALDQIEDCETEIGAKVGYLCVVYSVSGKLDGNGEVAESGGWASTSEPSWVTSAMLRRAADAIDDSVRDAEDDE